MVISIFFPNSGIAWAFFIITVFALSIFGKIGAYIVIIIARVIFLAFFPTAAITIICMAVRTTAVSTIAVVDIAVFDIIVFNIIIFNIIIARRARFFVSGFTNSHIFLD